MKTSASCRQFIKLAGAAKGGGSTTLRIKDNLGWWSDAKVEVINALSAHADRAGLIDWIGEIKDNVRHAFAIHGEPDKVAAMEQILKEQGIPNAVAPVPGQTFQFD